MGQHVLDFRFAELALPGHHRGLGFSVLNHVEQFRVRLLFALGAREISRRRLQLFPDGTVALPLRPMTRHTMLGIELVAPCYFCLLYTSRCV